MGSTFSPNIEDCTKALNWKGQEKDTGMEAWGEDLFMQRCMDLHGVDKVSVWDLTVDSMCAAFRPEGQKKNAKWRPNCALTSTAAMHPFMKPYDYFECLKATQRRVGKMILLRLRGLSIFSLICSRSGPAVDEFVDGLLGFSMMTVLQIVGAL